MSFQTIFIPFFKEIKFYGKFIVPLGRISEPPQHTYNVTLQQKLWTFTEDIIHSKMTMGMDQGDEKELKGIENGVEKEEIVNVEIKEDGRMKTRGITLQSGKSLEESMTYTKMYGPSDFAKEYNAFRGNAFGLANTLSQSLVLKPSIDSLSKNLVFAGHLTNPTPTPSMPTSTTPTTISTCPFCDAIISGEEPSVVLA